MQSNTLLDPSVIARFNSLLQLILDKVAQAITDNEPVDAEAWLDAFAAGIRAESGDVPREGGEVPPDAALLREPVSDEDLRDMVAEWGPSSVQVVDAVLERLRARGMAEEIAPQDDPNAEVGSGLAREINAAGGTMRKLFGTAPRG